VACKVVEDSVKRMVNGITTRFTQEALDRLSAGTLDDILEDAKIATKIKIDRILSVIYRIDIDARNSTLSDSFLRGKAKLNAEKCGSINSDEEVMMNFKTAVPRTGRELLELQLRKTKASSNNTGAWTTAKEYVVYKQHQKFDELTAKEFDDDPGAVFGKKKPLTAKDPLMPRLVEGDNEEHEQLYRGSSSKAKLEDHQKEIWFQDIDEERRMKEKILQLRQNPQRKRPFHSRILKPKNADRLNWSLLRAEQYAALPKKEPSPVLGPHDRGTPPVARPTEVGIIGLSKDEISSSSGAELVDASSTGGSSNWNPDVAVELAAFLQKEVEEDLEKDVVSEEPGI